MGEAEQLAEFERYTKGFGSKMLRKMGWQAGEGLGKQRQGITSHPTVQRRPFRAGLGSSSVDRSSEPFVTQQPQLSQQLTQSQRQRSRLQERWRKGAQQPAQPTHEPQQQAAPEHVIDMRGPTARTVDASDIRSDANTPTIDEHAQPSVPMHDFQRNISIAVEMQQSAVQSLSGKLSREQQNLDVLLEEQQAHYSAAQSYRSRAHSIRTLVDEARSASQHETLSALSCAFADIRHRFSDTYESFEMSQLLLASCKPLVSQIFEGWQPLSEPRRCVQELTLLRPLLEACKCSNRNKTHHSTEDAMNIFYDEDDNTTDAHTPQQGAAVAQLQNLYDVLISDLVLPKLRSALLTWTPEVPEPAIALVEAWEEALPDQFMRDLLEGCIIPKLKEALERWNPKTSTIAPHIWMHPWLPRLATAMEELHERIRMKFSSALKDWHPRDDSALDVLAPWQKVLKRAEWEKLMTKAVIPKLEQALSELEVNPTAEDVYLFRAVSTWDGIVPAHHMIAILEHHFFPKWRRALQLWLQQSDADFAEIEQWYSGWKAMLPENVRAHERVRQQLNRALAMMDDAASGRAVEDRPQPAEGRRKACGEEEQSQKARKKWSKSEAASTAIGNVAAANKGATMRDILEAYAQEMGAEMMPRPGRTHEGLQVYAFGGVSVVMNPHKQLLKAFTDGEWRPVSLEQLNHLAGHNQQ